MDSLKLRRVEGKVVVTIPDDVLKHLNLKEGDSLRLTIDADGITLKHDVSNEDLDDAGRMMQRYDTVLKRLAR